MASIFDCPQLEEVLVLLSLEQGNKWFWGYPWFRKHIKSSLEMVMWLVGQVSGHVKTPLITRANSAPAVSSLAGTKNWAPTWGQLQSEAIIIGLDEGNTATGDALSSDSLVTILNSYQHYPSSIICQAPYCWSSLSSLNTLNPHAIIIIPYSPILILLTKYHGPPSRRGKHRRATGSDACTLSTSFRETCPRGGSDCRADSSVVK